MLNQYETVFILTPVLSETQIKEAVDLFKKIITSNGGEVLHEEDWGLKKLAYPIQKKSTGYYHLFEFKSEGSLIEKLELEYRRDERIIRYITVKLDKYSIAYADSRRTRLSESKKQED